MLFDYEIKQWVKKTEPLRMSTFGNLHSIFLRTALSKGRVELWNVQNENRMDVADVKMLESSWNGS